MAAKITSGLQKERLASGASALWLVLLVLIFLSLATLYASVVPPFEGPDSGAHFRYVAYLREHRSLPSISPQTAEISHELVLQPPLYYVLAAILTPDRAIEPALQMEAINPYYGLGLSRRATVSEPGAPAIPWALWIARGVSLIGGMLAVVGTWLLLRELLPASPWAALAAASVVGLNPQFLFTSASITNDTWPTATAVLTLWLAVRCVRRDEQRWPWWIGIGALAGLGALTKTSNLLVGLPLALVVLPYLWRRRWGRGLQLGLLAGLGALLSGGFWYWRNLTLYGSLMPLNAMMTVLPAIARTKAASAAEIWSQMPVVWRSYWGIYGYGILAQPWFYQVTAWMTAISAVGLLLFLLGRRRASDPGTTTAVALSALWFGAVFVSAISYMRIVRYADQGRLLFSASPAVALLLVVGWQSLLPRTLGPWLRRLVPIAFAALAVSQVAILREGYRIPPAVGQPVPAQRPINAEFAGGMNLVGVDLPMGAGVDSGGGLPITLYLQARQEITDYYTLFMHLTDDKGNLLWQFDGVPSEGRHPTRQWIPGQVFADDHVIRLGDIPADGLATLSIGFYPYHDPTQRQPLVNPGQHADRAVVLIRLHADPAPEAAQIPAPLAAWSNGIRLETANIDSGGTEVPQRVTLAWQSQAAVQVDYTISLQVLDDQGNMLAQVDQQPAGGEYPTSTWRRGDRIIDTLELPEVSAPWRRVILLLYDATGRRLPVHAGTSEAATDYFVLANR